MHACVGWGEPGAAECRTLGQAHVLGAQAFAAGTPGPLQLVRCAKDDLAAIIDLLRYDKKNSHGKVKFVLLHALGQPAIDIEVPSEKLSDAFDFYQRD